MHEGDRQAPEGFYTITPELMNPNSNFYLAINTGFPNSFDKANDRDGTFLMIHGDCSSSGCYAMTDEQIGEIYSLARDSFLGGQPSFQVQAYPFRMTPANLARHRTNPHMAFWKMLKIGNDHFETTHLQPKVDVCDRRYVFDAEPPPNSQSRWCSIRTLNARFCRQSENRSGGAGETTCRRGRIRAIGQRQRVSRPNPQRARRRNEHSFPRTVSSQDNIACDRPAAGTGIELPQLPPVPWTDNDGSLANKFFGALPKSKPGSQAHVASTNSTTHESSADSATAGSAATPATKPAPQSQVGIAAKPTSGGPSEAQPARNESQQTAAPQPSPVPQPGANAAAPPTSDKTEHTLPAVPESFLGR